MRGNDIIGYTLAEIALALLFVVVLLGIGSQSALRATAEQARKDALEAAERALEAEERARRAESSADTQRRIADDLREELERLLGLRSGARPPCSEVGVAEGDWLFSVQILAADLYSLEGEVLSMDGLRSMFDGQLNLAEQRDCVYRVEAMAAPTLPLPVYLAGLRRLEGLFYVKRREAGPE